MLQAPENVPLKITEIKSGIEIKKQLSNLDLYITEYIIKLKGARFGPILIQKLKEGNEKFAIGQGIADKIIVESCNEKSI
ncbi:MAG TPA: ferrous iron transport protein A [Bacteroidota bacterium]|nr:ferrous iron transport protein A [Bacteroidota bacterium]